MQTHLQRADRDLHSGGDFDLRQFFHLEEYDGGAIAGFQGLQGSSDFAAGFRCLDLRRRVILRRTRHFIGHVCAPCSPAECIDGDIPDDRDEPGAEFGLGQATKTGARRMSPDEALLGGFLRVIPRRENSEGRAVHAWPTGLEDPFHGIPMSFAKCRRVAGQEKGRIEFRRWGRRCVLLLHDVLDVFIVFKPGHFNVRLPFSYVPETDENRKGYREHRNFTVRGGRFSFREELSWP